ncbi:hypothetical protein GE061_019429 [Apolygus lucorum]|uniref:Uncharacterized protein n=1 Tax=Apolygus lucorum TaxID=248454 RepID=A0A6A4JE66_APOLU|nr:hypothetical protein GE061_019429 [Apolygus lucorum]
MRKAFLACQDAKLKPQIISEDGVSDVPQGTNVVFVLQEFSGAAFRSLSCSESLCRVVGPRCLYHCVTNEVAIPSNESPVFTMSMKGVIATASKLPQNRKEEIAFLISCVGGSYTDKLTSSVTHLISEDGWSPKCEKAIEHKIPMMRHEWAIAVWQASKKRDLSAFDEDFIKYKLPPFKGMHISCSNLAQGVKEKIQAAVESNELHEYKKFVAEIDLSDAALCGLFLDGCKIFLSGFTWSHVVP